MTTTDAKARSVSLQCVECGALLDPFQEKMRCECGGLLEVIHELSELSADSLRETWLQRRQSLDPVDQSGVWRFREVIAPLDTRNIVSRFEGGTGLYRSESLAEWAGVSSLRLKHEGENPTGSFKDRGMTVGVSIAKMLGARMVACASTGNTSASLASYAAFAGMSCVVLVPAGQTSSAKLSQASAYGAHTLVVRGDFDRALKLLQELAPRLGLYILNSVNPWRLEGQKSVMIEMLEALEWKAPDWVILPGGNLGNTSAFTKALLEMKQLGLIERLPRVATIQAVGAAPFAQAYKSGWVEMAPVNADTIATAIRIGDPVNYPKARRGLERLNGVATSVSDTEIMDAKALIDRAGIGCEPASAASLAGLRKLVSEGVIERNAKVAAMLTGHVLKDPVATSRYHEGGGKFSNSPVEVDADESAILSVLEAK